MMTSARLLSIGLGLTTVLAAGCNKAPAPPQQKPIRPVTVAQAVTRDVPVYIDEIGNCSAYESVTVQPQVSGEITHVDFTDGVEVKKGDLLFTIDERPYTAALDKAKATLEQDRAKARYDQAQLKRFEELQKTKVVAPQDLDNARSTAEASQAAVHADEAAVATAQINLGFCQIRSPIDGRASKRMIDIGNVVAANNSPLLLIQRQDPIYVDFTIPESALPQVRHFTATGELKVAASFPDDPDKNRLGQLNFMDSGVQQSTGTVRLRSVMENQDRLFWPGQFVNVRLLLDILKDAVLVPNEAVQVGGHGPFVFVVKPDSTVELRPVKPGQRQGDNIVVADGLKPGETVVVTGQIALAPGAQVSTTPAKANL